jgi:urea-proton symporter
MYGTGYIFSKPFFTGWVTVGIIWIFCSFFAVGLFPVFEGRKTLVSTLKNIYLDITGKWHPPKHEHTIQGEEPGVVGSTSGGDVTPVEKGANEKTTVAEE